MTVVARVHRTAAADVSATGGEAGSSTAFDTPNFGDAPGAVRGPGRCLWWPYVDDEKTPPAPSGTLSSEWQTQPSENNVSVRAKHPKDYRAGLAFKFFDDNHTLDLSQYSTVQATVDLIEGDRFELFLGRGPDVGCSYVFGKQRESNIYESDLSSPNWCVPSQCGFNLQVNGGLFLAHVPSDSQLVASLSDLHFYTRSTGVRAGSANGLDGSNGPGGYCWFLGRWNENVDVAWKSTPTSSSADGTAYSSENGGAGIDFEVPQDMKLSQYRQLVLDATVTDTPPQGGIAEALLQAVRQNSGRSWYMQGDGTRRGYTFDLTTPEFSFGPDAPMSLDEVERFEIVNRYGGRGIRVKVQGVKFVR